MFYSKLIASTITLSVLASMCVACEDKEEETSAAESELVAADATYKLRGVVKDLPAKPDGKISIQHEEIPDFKNAQGEKVGMASMTMPFAVSPEVALEGVEAGDKIRFTYEVRFNADPMNRVVSIEELPPETELNLK